MFSDDEHRILLSAMGRKMEICEGVDNSFVHEPYETTLTDICKSINRKIHDIQHKYQWHDLRKNPDDLPQDCKIVLMCVKYKISGWISYQVNSYINGYVEREPNELEFDVIAWREVEPFEGEEE